MGNNELFIRAQPREEKLFGEQEGFEIGFTWFCEVIILFVNIPEDK